MKARKLMQSRQVEQPLCFSWRGRQWKMVSVQTSFFPSSYPQDSFCWGFSEWSDDQNNNPSLSISQRNGCRPWEILFGQTDSHREGSFHNAHASAPLGFCNTQSTWSEQREKCCSAHSVSGVGRFHTQMMRGVTPQSALAGGHLMAG